MTTDDKAFNDAVDEINSLYMNGFSNPDLLRKLLDPRSKAGNLIRAEALRAAAYEWRARPLEMAHLFAANWLLDRAALLNVASRMTADKSPVSDEVLLHEVGQALRSGDESLPDDVQQVVDMLADEDANDAWGLG